MNRMVSSRIARHTRTVLLPLTLAAATAWGAAHTRLEERVDSALAADDSVGIWRFAIDNRDGTVTLSATVPTQAIRQRAIRLAAGTPGVTDVIDRIVVQAPAKSPGATKRRSAHHDGM